MTRDDIVDIVRRVIAESQAIPSSGISPGSRLVKDLGVDSLDLLDLIFTLEKACACKLQGEALSLLTRVEYDAATLTNEGWMRPEDIERLAPWLPALAASPDRHRVHPRAIFSFITVESLVLLIESKRAAGSAGAPATA